MYISTGSFIIRGKRNFINPPKLELGFTLMFCLTEESVANHMGERRLRDDESNLELTKTLSIQSTVSEQEINDSEEI